MLWTSELCKQNAKDRQAQGGRAGRAVAARGWAGDLHGEWLLSRCGFS